ncbi:MAG: hypothetical protein WD342_12290 [Verrucomicrobiales bacterium]
MSTLETALGRLPPPILDKLEAMIGRVRRLLFIRGFFATLAVGLACLLAVMAVDAAVTLFSPVARWSLSLAGLLVTLAAAWRFLVLPLSRRFTLTHMARILEIRHPELQERISTAVELLSSEDPESIKGSEELIAAVVESAVVDVKAVDPKTEFTTVRTRRYMKFAAAGGAVVLLLLALWPQQSWTLMTRAVAPFLDIGNAYADSLVVDPGDVRIAKGDNVTVAVSVDHKRLRRAEIRRRLPDDSETVERMRLVADEGGRKTFSITFPNVRDSFEYRVRAGSAVSEYFDVEAVDPPAVETLTIRYDFPDYTGAPAVEAETETGEIRAVAHTRVTVTALTNKPLRSSKLLLDDTTEIAPPSAEGDRVTWDFELDPGMSGTWSLELVDTDHFANSPVSYPLEVLPDKPPTVQISRPALRELTLRPTERLPLFAELTEDFGVADLAVLVTPEGDTTPIEIEKPLPVRGNRGGQYFADTFLDLADLDLKPEQRRLGVQLRARDGRPEQYDGPGIGLSETIFITLDRRAKSLADQAIEAQRQELDGLLRESKRELERARKEMGGAEQELKKSSEVNPRTRDTLERFSEHTEAARDNLDEMATLLESTMFREEARQARQIADEPVAEALAKADLIPVTDEKEERVAEAGRSKEKIEEALRGLDELEKSLREADEVYDTISKLNDLANRQQEVAQRAEEWSERANRERAELPAEANEKARRQFDQRQQREQKQFRSEQDRVENQLGEMLKDNAAALAEVLEQQRKAADRMAREAAALAEEQQALGDINREATESGSDQQEQLRERLIAHLLKKQEHLANDTRRKASPPPQSEPSANERDADKALAEALSKAVEKTQQAAEELANRDLDRAGEAAAEAGESLAEAAERDPREAKPEGDPASEAAPEKDDAEDTLAPLPSNLALMEMQHALSQQLEAVKSGNLQEALGQMEAQLAEEAKDIQAAAGQMEATMRNLDQDSAATATDQAEQALRDGAKQAGDSSSQLDRAQQQQSAAAEKGQVEEGELAPSAEATMRQTQAAQQQSRDSLARASEAFGESSREIGQTLEGLEPSDMDDRVTNSQDLAEGFEEVSESSRSQDAQEAAGQSKRAAESLRELARSAMRKLGDNPPGDPLDSQQPLPPSDNPEDPNSTSLNESGLKTSDASGDGVPPELSELGISAADWTRFKGALAGGNATAIETQLPAEYRELVGRYFQVIAKEARKEE